MNYRYTIVTLGELLTVTRDGEKGFCACAANTRNDSLKRVFMSCASRRAAAAAELRELIGQLGGDPRMQGSILAAPRRGWLHRRAALALNDDDALVDECENGEDHALEVYRNALDDHLPEFVRQTVLRQFEGMMSDHDQIRVLRNETPHGGVVVVGAGGHAPQ
jgi:uncharacterized protein (TIGR02284 family)